MSKKVKKAVIPAAGFGTRFLPMTKASPKEMLPVVDKPVIQFVVEEAVSSGITDIIIVTGANKRAIEDHFDLPTADLVGNLKAGGKNDKIDEVKEIGEMANFVYIRQKGPYGNGTPVLCAEPAIDGEPFVVMWGDEFIYSDPPRLKQMMDVYDKYGGVVISGIRIPEKEDLKKYGIADIDLVKDNVYKIKRIVEKPDPDKAPSNMATHGAYILPPDIFPALRGLKPGKGGEIWLVEAINVLRDQGVPIYACEIQNGKYYDTGNKMAYMQTVVEFAIKHKEIGGEFSSWLKQFSASL